MRDAKRPRLLWILLWLMFAQAAMYLTFFVLYGVEADTKLQVVAAISKEGAPAVSQFLAVLLLVGTWLVLGFASVIIGVGLRGGRPWAWTAALVLEGAILILALETYINRQANLPFHVAMAAATAVVFMLNQREIQIFYRAHREEPEGRFGK